MIITTECAECGELIQPPAQLCPDCKQRGRAHRERSGAAEECVFPCQHHNALTCQARQHSMSRFNARIAHKACTCWCHRDKHNNPVDEAEWRARKARAEQRKKKSA